MILCEIGQRGAEDAEWCEVKRKKFILKSERKILVFAIPHPFMDENFQFSEHACVCIQTGQLLAHVFVCVCVFV